MVVLSADFPWRPWRANRLYGKTELRAIAVRDQIANSRINDDVYAKRPRGKDVIMLYPIRLRAYVDRTECGEKQNGNNK